MSSACAVKGEQQRLQGEGTSASSSIHAVIQVKWQAVIHAATTKYHSQIS